MYNFCASTECAPARAKRTRLPPGAPAAPEEVPDQCGELETADYGEETRPDGLQCAADYETVDAPDEHNTSSSSDEEDGAEAQADVAGTTETPVSKTSSGGSKGWQLKKWNGQALSLVLHCQKCSGARSQQSAKRAAPTSLRAPGKLEITLMNTSVTIGATMSSSTSETTPMTMQWQWQLAQKIVTQIGHHSRVMKYGKVLVC